MTKRNTRTDELTALLDAVATMTEALNPNGVRGEDGRWEDHRDADGTAVEARPFRGGAVLLDMMAGTVHRQIVGDGKRFDGSAAQVRTAHDQMLEALDRDPEFDHEWTIRAAQRFENAEAWHKALVALKEALISGYIDANAGLVHSWQPYDERDKAPTKSNLSDAEKKALVERARALRAKVA